MRTDNIGFIIYEKQYPVVLLNNRLDMEGLLCVTSNQYGGGGLAMEHLLE